MSTKKKKSLDFIYSFISFKYMLYIYIIFFFSISLLRYCNKNCRCSDDANFSPICDNKNLYTFYTPCHAGCTNVDDTGDVKKFSGCNCIEEITGLHGNNEAIQGPCGSITCQYGWIVFEVTCQFMKKNFLFNILLINLINNLSFK